MIKMKDIIREGDKRLNQKSIEVELPLSKEDEKTIKAMKEYIGNSVDPEIAEKYGLRPAVGLSAVQIGKLKRMLVIWMNDEKGAEHCYSMINPKIISYSEEKTYLQSGEGCLSIDREVKGYVHRPKRVTVQTHLYQEGKLVLEKLRLKGYVAIVFLHEYDHLNGILFPERINKENPFFVPENSSPLVFPRDEENEESSEENQKKEKVESTK